MRDFLLMIIKSFYSFDTQVAFCAQQNFLMVDARKQKPAAVNVYLLSCVDIVFRYIEVDFTFGLLDNICYIEKLTNKEASTLFCSVVKHAGSGRA